MRPLMSGGRGRTKCGGAETLVRDLMESASAVGRHVRLALALPRLLRLRIDPVEAEAALRARLAHRGDNFLALLKQAVYDNPGNPYHVLLCAAGCEYGDVERLVRAEGLEGALRGLLEVGVYLAFDELRGSRPAARGSTTVQVSLDRLANPLTARSWAPRRGSRKPLTRINVDPAAVLKHYATTAVYERRRGSTGRAHAIWDWNVSSTVGSLISHTVRGIGPERWFTPVDPGSNDVRRELLVEARWLHRLSLLSGSPIPAPVYAPLDDPEPIFRWIDEKLRGGRAPEIQTHPSAAVRLAEAAARAGRSLDGVWLDVQGEPTTPARLDALTRAGARVVVHYDSEESGTIARGCMDPVEPDECHVFHDMQGLIQPGATPGVAPMPPDTLLLTTLAETARYVLINASIGDEAIVTRRVCGCPLQQAGWTIHVHSIRSFEKLTAGAMSFPDGDVVRVLEETLPARFGGGPVSYQLVEDEAPDGQPALRLRIDPSVGPLDDEEVIRTFVAAIGRPSVGERMMAETWSSGRFLSVERGPLIETPSGKIIHRVPVRQTR